MKIYFTLLIGLFVHFNLNAQDCTSYLLEDTFLYESSDASSEQVAKLMEMDTVAVKSRIKGYFEIEHLKSGKTGWVKSSSVEMKSCITFMKIKGLPDYKTGKPTYRSSTYRSSSSKKSTSVQCSGYTQKGTRCKNRTTNSSGRCHYHN